MPLIEVLPGQLQSAGSRQAAIAAELRELGGRLIGIGASAAGGAGEGRVAGSMMDCCQNWSSTLVALADAVDGYGANLTAGAFAYTATDAGVIPARPGER